MIGFLAALFLLQLSADSIMWKVHNRPKFKDMKSIVELRLVSKDGKVRIRKLKSFSITDPKTNETKMLMVFIEPPDVRGTKFLIHEHKGRDDDMWFYLPALRKVKRIAARGKAGSFMGSDFSNYDIGGGEYEDWNYRLLREEELNGVPTYVIECTPKSEETIKKSGYTKIIKWVRKDNYLVQQSIMYDRSGDERKKIVMEEFRVIEGIPFETKIVAIDLDTEHRSEFIFSDIRVNKGLKPSMFTVRYLER